MDINTNLTYVTCIYDDLYDTEFGGRPDSIWRRYYFGLESFCKVMAPIVVFTWEKNVEKVENYFCSVLGEERFNKQMKVLPFNLQESPYYDLIKSIKTTEQGVGNSRSYDLMAARYLFLKTAIQKNYFNSKYFFLADAGLSHCALFPSKYLTVKEGEKQYTECSLFTPKIVTESIKRCKDTILFIKHNGLGHWLPPEYVNQDVIKPEKLWYIIGGYFGGVADKVDEFCSIMLNEFEYHIKTNKLLFLDEQLATMHMSYNYEKYVYEEFNSWYHEDSGDWVKEFIIGKKKFYEIFENFNL
jgi:hypothetical protein